MEEQRSTKDEQLTLNSGTGSGQVGRGSTLIRAALEIKQMTPFVVEFVLQLTHIYFLFNCLFFP